MQEIENPNNNLNTDVELSFEERFKQAVEKVRPYLIHLWGCKKRLMIINSIILVITLLYLIFMTKPYYDSTVTILPDYGTNMSSMLSQLSGLASLAGVNVGKSTPAQVYQELVTSESVLSPVIYAKYKTQKFDDSVDLIQYFEIKPNYNLTAKLQKRKMFLDAFNILSKGIISSKLDQMTQILTINSTMPESKLSADVVNNVALSLDNYIQTQMRTSASEQRKYIGKRVQEVKDSLTNAENKLKDFNDLNRIIIQSPELTLQQSRLQRNIDILSSVYLQLAQQYELAKVQEVKDTPVINIEELAKNPIVKAGPKRLNSLIIIMFFSVLFSTLYYLFIGSLKKYYSYLGIDLSKIRKKKVTK